MYITVPEYKLYIVITIILQDKLIFLSNNIRTQSKIKEVAKNIRSIATSLSVPPKHPTIKFNLSKLVETYSYVAKFNLSCYAIVN